MTPEDLPVSFRKSSLEGKVAVVTGSTQGLGEATARLFRERGYRGLVLTGRNAERGNILSNELTTDSCLAVFVRADLEDLDEVRNIFRVTDMTFGTVDILVNAAATTDRGSLWDTTPEDYDRIMNVNTRAPFFLMQDAARIMEREKVSGSIINISSTASYGSMPMIAAYGMSKGALNVATKNFAYSLMWSRIRVNALAIGWMDTPGEDAIQRRLHCDSNEDSWKQEGEANQPFGRLLHPEEVARCIAFCASEESGMMTGCVIDFDQSVWGAGNAPVPPRKEEWARAKGMTFSFQDETQRKNSKSNSSKTDVPPTPTVQQAKTQPTTTEDAKESKKSTGKVESKELKKSTTKLSPKTGSRKSTPRSTPRSSPKASPKQKVSRKSRSKERLKESKKAAAKDDTKELKRTTPKNTPKSSPKATPNSMAKLKADASANTAYILSASRVKMGSRRTPPPVSFVVLPGEDTTESESEQPMLWVPDISDSKPDDDMEMEIQLPKEDMFIEEKIITDITPPVTPESEGPKFETKQIPAHVPHPDEAGPDRAEFKHMLKQQEHGGQMQLDDYLPGTGPFLGSKEQAKLAKKKFADNQSDSQDGSQQSDNNSYLPSALSPKPPKPKGTMSSNALQRKLQDAGDTARPDAFFAANDPVGRKKERGNKKPLSRSSDHGDYRAARVGDWLGGDVGKNQCRSYKVKGVRDL